MLAIADPAQRDQTLALMRRFVAATPVDQAAFRIALTTAYGAALGLDPVPGEMTGTERAALAELDERFESDAWLAGPALRASPNGAPVARQVKVRAGVWTLGATRDGASVAAALVKGRVHEVRLYDRGLDGRTDEAEQALVGLPLTAVAPALAAFGDPGRRLAAAFGAAEPARL